MTLLKKILLLSLVTLFFLSFQACSPRSDNNSPEIYSYAIDPVELDINEIKERGYLTAIVDNSATSYFIYKGRPMGYEYEMLKWFCDDIDVELRIIITNDIAVALEKLNRGEADVAAFNLTVTKERKKYVDFTEPLYLARQVLVQKKPDNWRSMKIHQIEKLLIRDPIELIGEKVYVRKNSAFASRLSNLSDEIGGDIIIIEDSSSVEVEELIRMVAEGEIKYTVADEDVAMLSATFYPVIDVKTPISFSQKIAWAIRSNSDSLESTINNWLERKQKTTDYYVVYNKYFKNLKRSANRSYSEFSSVSGDKLSPYDEEIKETASTIGWDWRLLASLIYQESHFDPNASSWAGAKGLMQLVENTAEEFGAVNLNDPKESLMAGAAYINWLQKTLSKSIEDSVERQKFILGAYNVGIGHIEDARRLTKKYGGNPDVWTDNVAKYLLYKSKKRYYSDPVVKYGYCRGAEPVNYVDEILKRFKQYKQLLKKPEDQNLQANNSVF
ncbi:transporter substrate-binding domain-containing protein [Marivirga sp. S37H4]|uniref:Transporter substrate-binding domain-containing protein n=1 Tax=Marivirga aurantiaca TaxID=2802615 RepID=A0A934X0E0_9BACT|nr:transporter substrate-binding domain-containing protein [Marivirga aurantiaca]MBK6266603.1 transporter substrate-binding domain-containing protein [Marivirga aurantiaca]